jgi:glycosyltransferase involved in cell wall biosynthesis
MLRVLHVLDHSLPLHSGYAFRTRAIMTAQVADGLEVKGVTGLRHRADGPDIETVENLEFHRTRGAPSGPGGVREWREITALTNAISALVAKWRPDVLHAHSPALCGLAGLRAARRHDLPLVYEIRAFWEDAAVGNGTGRENSVKYRLTRGLENRVVAGADAVVTICHGLRDDLIARGYPGGRIGVMPNGVDLNLFGQAPKRDGRLAKQLDLGDGPVIGFIGSFYDYEGLDDLIDAMPALLREQPDARLLLVGGGPMEDEPAPPGESLAGGEGNPLRRPRAARRGQPLLLAVRRHGLSAQGEPADRAGHAAQAARGDGARQARRRLLGRRAQGAHHRRPHRHAVRARRSGRLRRLAGRPAAPTRRMAAMRDVARAMFSSRHDWARNVRRYQDVYQALLPPAREGRLPAAA